ncbi:riboflavin biosynthesis protein RibD [Paenibacillus sp. J31TS4]|uniref:bifunctional diaminohydroxyphosphoribosylaminopyrimidine deaminase/5-amino-6-(5-phosphoribosylamino)uracil reductase RibD n=1 Tax=Paenibacillus sp. J31TS4 TaxID=2807195 RepID=UPI001B164165|nr:bifunctional diaminohydroxyphosphoribosylaminopyrimidine deaminase/5-amino-6-(5-phosphoribosylamino)uracil reductase RibD [Paenibacillus sp. J31TS4]GIP37528.1 riboflavin biosynthesis protein RibD [Paenibacillus sp. J31TS4]
MDILTAESYMRLALQLAEGAQGQTGINPVVGCVIVKEGRIVGTGAHLKRGSGHAEVNALRMAGPEAEGSTVYVTLEPCSHYGKTPPCSDRLIDEKVAKVVVATLDPNPLVAGSGVERLRASGIEVEVGLLEEEARTMNEAFNKYIVTGMPFVALKTASTLDGKIASRTGDSKWITNERSRAFVHTLRHRYQAIMAGIGTVLADDPHLTTRLSVPALDPARIVVDSRLRLPEDANVLKGGGRVLVLTTELGSPERRQLLEAAGAEVVVCGEGPEVDLAAAMRELGRREIASILLEGGGRLNGAMLEHGLIDKCYLFYAPKIIGGDAAPGNFRFGGFDKMQEAVRLTRLTVQTFEEDFCLIGYPQYGRRAEARVHRTD